MLNQKSIYRSGQAPLQAFSVAGVNVARAVRLENESYDLLARNLELYLDPATNKSLDTWVNPLNGMRMKVENVQQDVVSANLPATTSFEARQLLDDYYTCTTTSVFNDDTLETLTYTTRYSELTDDSLTSTPSTMIHWIRASPFLPWMGNQDNNNATLLFSITGNKVPHGWEGLPPVLKNYIGEHLPKYKEAPWNRTE
ncbi:hypothetical protein N0V90_007111 [Kalmusia sp. IMI 367209]|nr:hypothetical protein N0V90_007111 [Kalmusia sp. IMI 367209]